MKLSLIIVWTFISTVGVFAQGTLYFTTYYGGQVNAPVYLGGVKVSGSNYMAALILDPGAGQRFGSPTTTFRSDAGVGYVRGVTVTFPGVTEGATVIVSMFAWDSHLGAITDPAVAFDAWQHGEIAGGCSPAIQVSTGGGLTAPPPLTGLQSFSLSRLSCPPPTLGISPGMIPGLVIDGAVGFTYGIQSTASLSDPSSWRGVTNVTILSSPFTWRDSQAWTESQRYYRVVVGGTSMAGLLQQAGELFVDVDAAQLPLGPLPSIRNNGTLGGWFEARGGATMTPVMASVGGTKGIRFDGDDYLQLVTNLGGLLISPPAGLVGPDPTRSIEVWALNPLVDGEESMVSWGKRGGPNGSNMSFGYGSDFRWGAVVHWGGEGPDLGWHNSGGNPLPNQWHQLVYTFDGATHTTLVYADGALANREVLDPGVINTHPATSINLGTELEPNGVTPTATLRLSGFLARVRIHDGVLTPAQIEANYQLELPAFLNQ